MDPQVMVETMKSSFLFSFRTGNLVVDTLITGFIIMCSSYLLTIAQKLTSLDFFALMRWIRYRSSASIIITGKKVQRAENTRLEYSTNFFAVLYQIKKLNCEEADILQLSEVPIQEPDEARYYQDGEQEGGGEGEVIKGMRTNLIVSQVEPFKFKEKDVFGLVNIMQNSDNNEKNPQRTEEFQITITSEIRTAENLRQLLNNWVKEYEAHLNSDSHLKYFVYTPGSQADEDYYDATSNYSEFRFESGKSFDNIFFPEKESILKRINFFAANKEWYKKRGIPYTMGFLLYGEPGCGKTSTIKAIANHTQRHIVAVPLNKIKTGKELLNVFYNVKMNYQDIPLNKRLYVLEDIDCADLKDIVKERESKRNKKTKEEDLNDQQEGEVNEATEEEEEEEPEPQTVDKGGLDLLTLLKVPTVENFKNKHKLTLANLLEVLDGVMEMEGRMLVITTNYPEKLDKALIRPGRIDMKLKFERCTVESLVEMFSHYFDMDLPEDFDASQLPEMRWTPAEASQVFLNNMNDPAKSLRDLVDLMPENIEL